MAVGVRRLVEWCARILTGIIVLLVSGTCLARVGGGEGFGGGGGDHGTGGGGGDLVAVVVSLAIRHPYIGIPLLIGVIGVMYARRKVQERQLQEKGLRKAHTARIGQAAQRRKKIREGMQSLIEDDPNFSEILFLDFAQMIYARLQESRGSPRLEALGVYLSEELMHRLEGLAERFARVPFQVHDVIVGSITIWSIGASKDCWKIACEVEANYSESLGAPDGKTAETAYFSRARLTFRRAKGVLSKGPDEIHTLGCPSCGSPMKLDRQGVCAYCGQATRPGEFHWELYDLEEIERRPREQMPLDLRSAEIGTDFPTVRDPNLGARAKAFRMRYPGEDLNHLIERAKEVFETLQRAWTTGHWERARAFETDRLFQMHTFWMERYREKKCRNVLDQIEVRRVTIVKLDRDAFFELATLRILASMIDTVVDQNGKVIGGNDKTPRVFSEYWTFIRRAGFEPGQKLDSSRCPSCGAPVSVSMHGRCEYCDANLASGDFDWTLAKIEQDEIYAG